MKVGSAAYGGDVIIIILRNTDINISSDVTVLLCETIGFLIKIHTDSVVNVV